MHNCLIIMHKLFIIQNQPISVQEGMEAHGHMRINKTVRRIQTFERHSFHCIGYPARGCPVRSVHCYGCPYQVPRQFTVMGTSFFTKWMNNGSNKLCVITHGVLYIKNSMNYYVILVKTQVSKLTLLYMGYFLRHILHGGQNCPPLVESSLMTHFMILYVNVKTISNLISLIVINL